VFVDHINNADNIAVGSSNEISINKSSEYEALSQEGNFILKFKELVLIIFF